MKFDLLTRLEARKRALRENRDGGFTLVELIIVVLVIGILAAIAVPIYVGVQNDAKDSAVKSDLANAKIAVVSYLSTKGTMTDLGTSLTPDKLKDHGLTKSEHTTSNFSFKLDSTGAFCIAAISTTGNTFYVLDSEGVQGTDTAGLPSTCLAPTTTR